MRRCPGCGKEVEEGLRFCVWCGVSLETGAVPPPIPAVEDTAAAGTADAPAPPLPPAIPTAPGTTPQPSSPREEPATRIARTIPAIPQPPSPPTAMASPPPLPGNPPTVTPGTSPGPDGEVEELDETVVLSRPPEGAVPDPTETTVISAPAAAARGPKPPPADDAESAPAVSGHRPTVSPPSEPELVEIEEDEPAALEELPPAQDGGTKPPPGEVPATEGSKGARSGDTPTKAAGGRGGRRLVLAGGAAALVFLLAGLGWFLLGGHRSRGGPAPTVKVVRIGESPAEEILGGEAAPPIPHQTNPIARKPEPTRHTVRSNGKQAQAPPALPQSAVLHAAVDVSGLAAWPSPAAIVYSGKRFRGRSQTFGVGKVPHLRGTVLRDNAASSLKVVGGARLTLFLKPGFQGRNETFAGDSRSLKGSRIKNNRASSLKVEPPRTGAVLWRVKLPRELGIAAELERRRDAVVVRSGEETAYVVSVLLPPGGAGLAALVKMRAGLTRALGTPRSSAVRVAGGRLAVQLFARGVVAYSPGSKRGWYRRDGR